MENENLHTGDVRLQGNPTTDEAETPTSVRSQPYNSVAPKFLNESIPEIQAWMAEGRALAQSISGHQWQIADWMLWGENNIGNIRWAYDCAEKATGFSRKTLQEWAYVARHVSMRMEGLSFNHHQVVAALTPQAQMECLNRALNERLPVTQLREMARWQPRRMSAENEAKPATMLLKLFFQKNLDLLEICARKRGFISDESNSAVGRLVWQLIEDYCKTCPELDEAKAEYKRAVA